MATACSVVLKIHLFFKKALEFDMTMAFTKIVGLIISDDETTVT